MKKYLYMAVAAIAVLSSCGSDNDIIESNNGNNKGESKVFTGIIEGDATTRTTISDGTEGKKKVNWESTDEISINGVTYTTTPDKYDATKATFAKKTAGNEDPTATYKACYPATMASGTGNNVTFSLPASYTYSNGNFNMPMYAESENTELGFKNICGVLAITVPSTVASSVSSIEVKSENQLNGKFTVDATNNYKLKFTEATLTTALQTVTLNCGGVTNTDSKTFYIPLPAGFYECLVIIVNDVSTTKTITMTTTVDVSIERNKIYPITFASNTVTSRGLAEATVSQGSETKRYVAWKQLWENGPKFATINVGSTIPNIASANSTSTDNSVKYAEKYVGGYYTWGRNKDDIATQQWGDAWRKPTKEELNHLRNFDDDGSNILTTANTTWTWMDGSTTSNQYVSGCTLAGRMITGNGNFQNNSIFFPAAGLINNNSVNHIGVQGYYCGSSSSKAYLSFYNGGYGVSINKDTETGYSVRAVLK